jgi:hypothetical protein
MNSTISTPSEYLTTIQAARHLNCSRQYLEIGRSKGYGPPYCKLGRAVRYRASALNEWMAEHECRPSTVH